jgi:hypothetical protein
MPDMSIPRDRDLMLYRLNTISFNPPKIRLNKANRIAMLIILYP